MGHERWFRGQHDGQNRPFDWLTAARQQGISEKVARALYERALQQAHGAAPDRVQEMYLALLADARRDASRPSPGKVTRTMRLAAEQAGNPRGPRVSQLTGQPIAPGKRTLISYIEPTRDARFAPDEQHVDWLSARDLSVLDAPSERSLQAHLAAASGHFEELDALDRERLAAELATPAEPSHVGRPVDDWGVARLTRTAQSQEGPVLPGYLPGSGRGAQHTGIAVHRKATEGASVADDAAERLRAAQGDSGTSLPEELRAELAEALGVPHEVVAGVRVHTGAASADAADAFAAEAFAIGADVHFAAGAYQPSTESGRRLIAHEVAHAVARPAATIAAGDVRVSEPDDTHERAADRFADAFTTHGRSRDTAAGAQPPHPVLVPGLDSAPSATIHRYAAQLTEDEEEERKRREKRRHEDGEPEQATDADPADGMQQSSGSDALAAGEQAREVPDADDVTAQEERPRGSGPLDQAMVTAGGDEARVAAQRARGRDGASNIDRGPDGTEADREQDEDGRTGSELEHDADDREPGTDEDTGESAGALTPPDVVPPGGQALVAPDAALDATTAPAARGDQTDDHGSGGDTPGSEQDGDADQRPSAQSSGDQAHGDGSSTHTKGHDVAATAAPGNGEGEIDFAETDIHRLVPPQPDEPPEAYEQRLAVARAELAQDRAYAIGRLTEFRAVQGERIAALSAMAPRIDHALTEAEQRATEQVSQAAVAQKRAVRAAVARSVQQAQAAAAAARSQIQSTYAATSSAIQAATTAARNRITASHQQALAATRTAERDQIGEVGRLYVQAESAFRAAANAAGSHATSVAADRARTYRAGRINRDDSFLDGPLTDNRCEARAEAAEKVGQAYRDELVKEGDKQVNDMRLRKPTDEAAVRQVAEEARRNLETAYRESLRGLDESRQRALASARQARDGALAGTSRTLQQTVSGLRGHERAQLANIDKQAAAQKKALRQQRARAARQLRGTLDRTIADLRAGLDQSIAAIRGEEVPEPEALDQTLAQCSQAIDSQVEQLRAGIAQGREQIAQALGQGGARSARALAQAASAAIASAQQTGAGAAQAIAQGAQAAAASFQQMAAAHQRTATQSAADAARGNTGITTGLGQAYSQLRENLQQGMQRNADAVRTGLIEVVDNDMGATITSEADEAAAQVQPRWKSVVKWVIIIAVVLVVAIVLGPMVIGAITGLAAGLGASAAVAGTVGAVVGGAIVGAGTAAVTTVVDNAFAGRNLLEGVGTAMAWGALGGALGGGASALLAGPMQGMSALARYGVELGLDMVVDTGINLLTGNLSWENFGTSLLTSMLVTGITSHPRVQAGSERSMGRGHAAGLEGGIRLRNGSSGAPRSSAGGPGATTRPDSSARGDSAEGPRRRDATDGAAAPRGQAPDVRAPRASSDGPAPDASTRRPTDAEGTAPRSDTAIPPDGDVESPVGGGVKGKDVYKMSGGGADNARQFHGKIDEVFLDKEGLILHGAVKRQRKKTEGGKETPVHVLDVNGVEVVLDIRMMSQEKFNDTTAASVHGGDQGPAMNTIRYENGVWKADIVVDQRLPLADYEKVLGHEFDEIAGVVAKENPKVKAGDYRNDSAALERSINAQQEARVFKDGGSSSGDDLTAHDRAAMNELARLANEIGSNRAGDATTGPQHHKDFTESSRQHAQEQSLQKMLDSMGITGMSDPRVKLLLDNVGKNLTPSARRWLTNYLYAKELGGPFTPKVVDHLLQPNPKNLEFRDWSQSGIGGGHDTNSLLDMVTRAPDVDGNPQFKLEHPPGKRPFIEITSSAGTTKVQNWEQYQYMSGRGYVKSTVPKTSVDDPAVHMAYLKEFHANVLKPAMDAGTLEVGLNPLINTDGLEITVGIKSLDPLEITTMFINAINF